MCNYIGILLTIVSTFSLLANATAQTPVPHNFVGHKVGADNTLLDWPTIVSYYDELARESDRVVLQSLGETGLGERFFMLLISSEHNLKNLAKYKNLQKQAANPGNLSDGDARQIARENVLVSMVILNGKSDALAGPQMGLEMAYRLATGTSDAIRRICDNVLVLLVPCMNPDGLRRAVQWYTKYLNTQHQNSPLTSLSHPVAGDEYDSDWIACRLPETQLLAEQMYQEWFPLLIQNVNERRGQAPRVSLSISGENDENLKKQIENLLAESGRTGIIWQDEAELQPLGSLATTGPLHNQIVIETNVANVEIASPLFYPPASSPAQQKIAITPPWQGGWWRLRDVIEYELTATLAALEGAAREKDALIYAFCKAGQQAITSGDSTQWTYIVPANQHNKFATRQMLEMLQHGGIYIYKTAEDLSSETIMIQHGDFLIPRSQAFTSFFTNIFCPSKFLESAGDGHIQDLKSGVADLLGVQVEVTTQPVKLPLAPLRKIQFEPMPVRLRDNGDYLILSNDGNSFVAVNRLLEQTKKVYRLTQELSLENTTYPAGTFLIPGNEINTEKIATIAETLRLPIKHTSWRIEGQTMYRLRRPKVALFQSWVPSSQAGQLRDALANYQFTVETVYDTDIRRGNLHDDYDAIILPDMPAQVILNGWQRGRANLYESQVPRPYLNGVGDRGMESLRDFMLRGGTLVLLGRACTLAATDLGLPVRIAESQPDSSRRFTILEMSVKTDERLAHGLAQEENAVFTDGPLLQPIPWTRETVIAATINFGSKGPDTLDDGITAESSSLQSAVIEMPIGEGRAVLITCEPLFHGLETTSMTFLSNALLLSRSELEEL